jgi:hypothetical protein
MTANEIPRGKRGKISDQERQEADAWLEANAAKIPPELQDEQGTKVPLGKSGRFVPVVELNEEIAGPTNAPHPTHAGPTPLSPWPGQSSAADQTTSFRPIEDEIISDQDDDPYRG